MSISYLVTLAALLMCACAGTHPNCNNSTETENGPVTVTPSGVIRGSWMETRRGRRFEAYRGIRYAEPPVGELRFQPPKLINTYSDAVDASEEGPACPQPVRDDYYIDEDCLRINVYTPKRDRSDLKRLPVLVYIHAGGFYSMSGRSDRAGPHYLLDKDMLLVTMNYRIGTLGFLSTGDEFAPGNNGLKDQVVALKWVQRNIAAFGGDPDMVTIGGCSAGSVSVMLHMISPMSRGLFHRAISISGSPIKKERYAHHLKHLAEKQAELVNCPTNTTRAIYDCLKTVPWRTLANTLRGFFEFGFDPVSLWLPVVENDFGQERFLSMDPLDAIREGKMHAVPCIIGQTTDEFFWKAFTILNNSTLLDTMNKEWDRIAPISFSLPRENATVASDRLKQAYLGGKLLVNDSRSADALGKLYGDAIVGFPVHRMANLMCRHSSQPVYYYEFSYIGNHSHYEDPTTHKPTGVAHHDDLIYLFTLSRVFPAIELGSEDDELVQRMTSIVYDFVKYGNPHPRVKIDDTWQWPAMEPTRRQFLHIGRSLTLMERLKEDRLTLWDELYQIQY